MKKFPGQKELDRSRFIKSIKMGGAILDAAVSPAHKRFNINLLEHAISISSIGSGFWFGAKGVEFQILFRPLRVKLSNFLKTN